MAAKRMKRGPYAKAGRRQASPDAVANHLRAWRLFRGLNQDELADAAGLSVGMVSGIERGDVGFSPDSLAQLAQALKITRGELLDVDPTGSAPFWKLHQSATREQRDLLHRLAESVLAPAKAKR